MNFSTYSLYVGNNRKFTKFKGYGDYVTLRTDSSDVIWSISDDDILEFKSVSGSWAEVRAIRTGFAYVCAEKQDGTRELCHISVIDNYTRLTTERIELNADKLNLKPGAEAEIIPVLYPKEVYNNGNLKKGGVTMCEVVERIEDRGKAALIKKMLDEKFATEQQIADLLKISVKEVKKIAAKVPVQA